MCFMKFRKKTTQQIETLQSTINELKSTIITQELKRLRAESADYKQERENLANIKLKVKSAKCLEDEGGHVYVEVVYETPTIRVFFDENGKAIRNDFFRSANLLNIINQKDIKKLKEALDKASEKAKL